MSTDKDFYQILNEQTHQLKLVNSQKYFVLTKEIIEQEMGIPTEKYLIWRALTGENRDNIAGVPGIGPKRAAEIINGTRDLDWEAHQQIIERNLSL